MTICDYTVRSKNKLDLINKLMENRKKLQAGWLKGRDDHLVCVTASVPGVECQFTVHTPFLREAAKKEIAYIDEALEKLGFSHNDFT